MEVEKVLDVIERPTHISHHGGMVQELLVLVSKLVRRKGLGNRWLKPKHGVLKV
jgi:hypothetical protein